MAENSLTPKEALTYGWNYFQLHATQRMSLFNFFIILASLLTTGIVTTSQDKFGIEHLPVVLSLMLIVLSVVFWKLDGRVKFLLKHVEDVLKNVEASTKGNKEEDMFCIFTGEEKKTNRLKKDNCMLHPVNYHLSYSKCLGSVYLFFGLLGFCCLSFTLLRIHPAIFSDISGLFNKARSFSSHDCG